MIGFSLDSNIREDHKQILLCLHGFGGDKESSVIAALRKELDKKGIGVAAFEGVDHRYKRPGELEQILDHTERFLLEESGGPKGIETDV